MAISNSTTLNDLVGQIVSADAQSAAYANRVMRPLVRGYSVPPGAGSIVVPKFQSVAVGSLTEGVAPSSTTMNTDGVTLTPAERGTYVQISKRALHADPFQDLAPYGEQLGRALAADEDAQILNEMNSFTIHLNDTSSDISLTTLYQAIAYVEGANIPGPYFAVFHPYSWAKLRASLADAATYAKVGTTTVEGFGEGFTNANGYVGSPFGIPCFISTQVPVDSASTPNRRHNMFFSREAFGAAWIKDIGIDVDDNVVSRAIDLMAWYSFDSSILVDTYGVIMEDNLA